MIGRVVNFIIDADWTAAYAVLVWIGVLLALSWTILMHDDPANEGLPEWDLRLRRAGILLMVAGFILSVLFGGNQGWAPWPTMLLSAFGFDFYLAAAIFTSVRRAKLKAHLAESLARDARLAR